MKKIVYLQLVFVALFSVYQANAQIQDPYKAIQLWHDFDQTQKRLTFHAENKDFCDYYLYISFIQAEGFEGMPSSGTSVNVAPGRRQILTYRVKEGAPRYSYRYHHVMYRGSHKKPNVDFIYFCCIYKN
jgi:hypothetical protein